MQTCLNQWNDYAPSLIRAFPRKATEDRVSAQLRFDYQLTDDLVVYAAYQKADRHITNVDNTLNLGSPAYNEASHLHPDRACRPIANPLITPRTVNTGLGFTFNPTGLPCGLSNRIRNRHGANDDRLRRGKRHDQRRGR